ncbi:sulfotransferase 6B1-like isoform X1 [Pleurodeles waltl]|uniref:sulfotransferase 6B1-like isoform X1 n=1 Tax=Pleurodeles waltl TaxID=8319 RepID=UPI003709B649
MADGLAGKASEEMFFTYQGILYPKLRCSPETFQALQDFVARKDDMMLVAYPKCGTNWCVQILNDLAATVAGAEEENILHTMLEFGAADKYKIMEARPSTRVYASHLHYDDIPKSVFQNGTKDLARGIQKIAEFFGFTLNEKQIQHIVNRATFEAMKARSPETHVDLAQAHFRKGVVGDWKNYFTEAQNREMDAKFEEFLAGTKLGKQLKYDVYCKT